MNDDMLDKLRAAMASGTFIMIKYYGGSQPGATREIAPLMILDKQVRARDLATNTTKSFALDKIEVVVDGGEPDYAPAKTISKRTQNLIEVMKDNLEELQQLGWHVVLEHDSIKLYLRSKSGTLRKHATVGLRRTYDRVITISLDGSSTTEEPSTDRPWYVFDPDYQRSLVEAEPEAGRSYKYLTQAVRVVLEQARRHAPNQEDSRYKKTGNSHGASFIPSDKKRGATRRCAWPPTRKCAQ